MISDTDAAWAAGFIDGEGHVTIRRFKNAGGGIIYNLSIEVANCDIRPLMRLKGLFGGSVYAKKAPTNPAWSQAYRWTIQTLMAKKCLIAISPYLSCKAEQAAIALELNAALRPQGQQRHPLTPREIARREELRAVMQSLNQRGIGKPQSEYVPPAPRKKSTQLHFVEDQKAV